MLSDGNHNSESQNVPDNAQNYARLWQKIEYLCMLKYKTENK